MIASGMPSSTVLKFAPNRGGTAQLSSMKIPWDLGSILGDSCRQLAAFSDGDRVRATRSATLAAWA
jgi:hypothetical protein